MGRQMNQSRRQAGHIWLIVSVLVLIAAVGASYWYMKTQQTKLEAAAKTSQPTKAKAVSQQIKNTEDLTKLPVGDGHISTTPQKGYVMSCQQKFDARKAGADHSGAWLGTTSWNLSSKTIVNGDVSWSSATISISLKDQSRIIMGNGLPVKLTTGLFPIQPGTEAYQYDRNPNSIQPQEVYYNLPASPIKAASPGCVPMGVIGYMTNGVALFNALDAGGRDAAAHEVQDKCDGHPEKSGAYHFHSLSRCVEAGEGNNQLVGYALDGFGIFGNKDAKGNVLTTADLDECHGTTSPIKWDGKTVNMYHYVLTHDYPYSIGCFRGTSVRAAQTDTQQTLPRQP